MDLNTKRTMISTAADLSVQRKCEIFGLSRSSYYYKPVFPSEEDLMILAAMDEIYTDKPFYGYRKVHLELLLNEFSIGKDKVLKFKRILGLETFYPKKKTSIPNKEHKIYPYLLDKVTICRPNQVWAADITYIRMKKGFCYMVAIIDWYSRKILSYRISNTLDSYFCTEALKKALENYSTPEIFNTDQGSQFTSRAFTTILKEHEIKISMDGKGRALDNIIIERFWRTIKYENIYISEYSSMLELQLGVTRYMNFYNRERFHSSLSNKTPDAIYKPKEQEVITLENKKGQLIIKKAV